MITGFNTDIEHGGTTYHVQTEDKGLDTPLILSLVYVGGAIIASKRTPYKDLVESGFDEKVLTERLQRQHKLICAAIRAGRVGDLKKKMGEQRAPAAEPPAAKEEREKEQPLAVEPPAVVGEAAADVVVVNSGLVNREAVNVIPLEVERDALSWFASMPPPSSTPPTPPPTPTPEPPAEVETPIEELSGDAVEILHPEILLDDEGEAAEELYLSLLDDEGDFRAGQLATIKIHLGRGQYGQMAVADASITVKVLGTSFRPLIVSTKTDEEGLAVVRALLPRFTSGRAAIIIRATADDDVTEMRRIIHQA